MELSTARDKTEVRGGKGRVLKLRPRKPRFILHLDQLEKSPWRREYLRFWQGALWRHQGIRKKWRQTLNRRLMPWLR